MPSPKGSKGETPRNFFPEATPIFLFPCLKRYANTPSKIGSARKIFCLGIGAGSSYCTRLRSPGLGGIRAYVIVVEDITELEKMQRMAAWREVAKRIAHEIKNPLTPIKLSAQRLDRKFGKQIEDPAFGQCTDLIVKQVERLQEMVQEFSSFAKLPEVQLSPDDVAPCWTNSQRSSVQATAASCGICICPNAYPR